METPAKITITILNSKDYFLPEYFPIRQPRSEKVTIGAIAVKNFGARSILYIEFRYIFNTMVEEENIHASIKISGNEKVLIIFVHRSN